MLVDSDGRFRGDDDRLGFAEEAPLALGADTRDELVADEGAVVELDARGERLWDADGEREVLLLGANPVGVWCGSTRQAGGWDEAWTRQITISNRRRDNVRTDRRVPYSSEDDQRVIGLGPTQSQYMSSWPPGGSTSTFRSSIRTHFALTPATAGTRTSMAYMYEKIVLG